MGGTLLSAGRHEPQDGLALLGLPELAREEGRNGQLVDQGRLLGETAAAAYDRAFTAVGGPWLAPGTQSAIRDYANQARSKSPDDRKQRQLLLRALMLAGPDAQVM